MELKPGAFNIVPASATLALELRALDSATTKRLEAALLGHARAEALHFGLGLEIEPLGSHAPAPMSPLAQQAISQAAESLGLRHIPLSSGADHDAQSLADLCPAGMIFIPSQGGASHSPREFNRWENCLNGANVLLGAALSMAESLDEFAKRIYA